MRPDLEHAWTCDEKRFDDEHALARHMAARIDAGEERVLFARNGCMFRLTYEDRSLPTTTVTPPVDAFWRSRTYRVTLITNSPTCVGGNVFTATWPDGYAHPPVKVIAKDAPLDAPAVVDGTQNDVVRVLTGIGIVLWPGLYDLR